MGFIDFLRGFFEETEKEVSEDIKEAKELRKESEKKLREIKKRKKRRFNLIGKLFESSEQELKENIKEAKKLEKEARKRLREIKKRVKRRKKLKPLPTKQRILIALGILAAVFLVYSGYKYSTSFHFVCHHKHPCEDCDFVINCPQFQELGSDEHYLHFMLENRKGEEVECYVNITLEKEKEVLFNNNLKAGSIPANGKRHFRVPMTLPGGNTDTVIEPRCNPPD